MAMRMPPQVAQQSALPEINRSSLVFFAGLSLILLNFFWQNGQAALDAVFHKGGAGIQLVGVTDSGIQILGLTLLTLAAEYGGDNAGTASLLFVGALWLLWLLAHVGTQPVQDVTSGQDTTGASSSSGSSTTSGGSGGQKK